MRNIKLIHLGLFPVDVRCGFSILLSAIILDIIIVLVYSGASSTGYGGYTSTMVVNGHWSSDDAYRVRVIKLLLVTLNIAELLSQELDWRDHHASCKYLGNVLHSR